MSSVGLFEVHITTHQHGSSEIDYRAVHKQMVSQGFVRVMQTTAQVANEVPGVYRLQDAQLTTAQVVEMIRLAVTSLGRRITVQVMKIEEEIVFTSLASTTDARAGTNSKSDRPRSFETKLKAQSGYPAWRRPR
jgi:hypothetical protein